MKARKKNLGSSIKKCSIRKCGSRKVACAGLMLLEVQLHSPQEAPSTQPVARSRRPGSQGCPGPGQPQRTFFLNDRISGEAPRARAPCLAAREGGQGMGSSAYENSVSRLWRGSWKQVTLKTRRQQVQPALFGRHSFWCFYFAFSASNHSDPGDISGPRAELGRGQGQ